MNNPTNTEIIDDDWDYDLILWVSSNKSLEQFEESLSDILEPIPIVNHSFDLGKIHCVIEEADIAPKNYAGVPIEKYQFKVIVPVVTYLIWGLIDRRFAMSLTLGLRTKFTCKYLVTDDSENFIMYSGTNLPVYYNANYPPWMSGELGSFIEGVEALELRI